jgi:plastocyanin
VRIAIEARDFEFPSSLAEAPAGQPFSIVFTNSDAAIPHNVTLATSAGVSRFSGKIITGISSITYAIPALSAGDYRVGCIVHPAMTGTLRVR